MRAGAVLPRSLAPAAGFIHQSAVHTSEQLRMDGLSMPTSQLWMNAK